MKKTNGRIIGLSFQFPLCIAETSSLVANTSSAFILLSNHQKRSRSPRRIDWMIMVYKVLQNVLLHVQFVLHTKLAYSHTSHFKSLVEKDYFDIVNFRNMFPITFSGFRFKLVMVYVGHLAEVMRSINLLKPLI